MMKAKNALILIILFVVIGLTTALAFIGIGGDKKLGYESIPLGLDLNGGVQITYEAGIDNPSDDEMAAAVSVIRKRLDVNNYTEAEVYREGSDRIYVEIPGVDDPNKAVDDIGKTAQLEFIGINIGELSIPEDLEFKTYEEFEQAQVDLAIEQGVGEVALTGADVKKASSAYGPVDSSGIAKHHVILELNADGTQKFAESTEKYIGMPIAITLDGQVVSMPTVNGVITNGEAIISGSFTQESARELANFINAGALPFDLIPIQSQGVGAKLGADSLETSVRAGAIGVILVLLFMLFYYRVPGLAADLALVIYGALVIIILAAFEVTLTLPGVAGIILSIGMAVDANVVIFSRIKEELYAGKGIRASIDAGFKKAMSAILDGNITTLIAAVVLWFFGSGPVKGFAQTLGVGIIVSMFTALVITRIILKALVELGLDKKSWFGFNQKKYELLQSAK